MAHPSSKFWAVAMTVLLIVGLLAGLFSPISNLSRAQASTLAESTTPPYITGPYTSQPVYPTVFNGDLRDLPHTSSEGGEVPAPGIVSRPNPANLTNLNSWVDPVAQNTLAQGQMPEPIRNFNGLSITDGGGWHPPDTNGDVGPNHYIQVVNIAIGIYDKATGAELVKLSYNDFFQGPIGTPCDNQNRGDVVVLYDPQVDRWVVTDFALPTGGPYYECIAVSQTADPVSGGWYYYALQTNTPPFDDAFNDYPKLGVWTDGWYMSANMFTNNFEGVRVWALDRASMIAGGPLNEVHFNLTPDEGGTLLPANIRGALPPSESPEYFANVTVPSTLNIWKFHVDWTTPGNSTFTGPVPVTVADFAMYFDVPQKSPGGFLDSLGDRMMMQLQYRNIDGVEALYANHSVVSGGVGGIRWYEIRDPGGTPYIFQQGTYQPDQNYRWMGSIAADKEGNIAIGYSVSSYDMYPAIRYAGRLVGETPNLLTQNEAVLIQGTGSQTGSNRWGDYSALTVDPVDDCTFWYTTEYLITNSGNWLTRIGSFKFPSCGEPKGTIAGYVYNSETNQPVAGVPVVAAGASYNFSTETDSSGHYSIDLIDGSYDLTAGPFLPGYPGTAIANGVVVSAGFTTSQDFYLEPTPSLVHEGTLLNDSVAYGNGNGFPEPGERGLQLSESLYNEGASTSTGITAKLTSLTAGVTVDSAESTYADIAAGDNGLNETPYVISIDSNVACGTDLNFQAVVTDSLNAYNTSFSINASVPLPRQDFYTNDVEDGAAGWTTGGTFNTWAITALEAHSPTHSWTDSPAGNYQNNTNSWVRTPALDLTGRHSVQLSGWFKYALETGYDYAYVEYSLDGGSNWNLTPLMTFNGVQNEWQQVTVDAAMLDNQPDVAIRIHLLADSGVVEDGIYVDDFALSSIPFECNYDPTPTAPTLVSPADGSWLSSPVTFEWQPVEGGAPVEGYIFYLDDTPVVTFTSPITTTTLDVTPWGHNWFVKATNISGPSLPSATWSLDVFGKFFLPISVK
ncbi:MAG: carboxypeptidase regulatory-like domain-containing protein [Anaerolineales bacterium]